MEASEAQSRPLLSHQEVSLPRDHLWRKLSLPVGAVGFLCLIAAFLLAPTDSPRFLFAYLVAYLFGLTLALGGLIFVLIQFVTRAGWSVVVRRMAENAMGTMPLFVVLLVPILMGLGELFEWTHREEVAQDPLLQHKDAYLNTTFFYIRAVIYLACWLGMAWWFRRESIRQDKLGDPKMTRRLQTVSAPAIIVFALTVTFASFDWIMSLDPHWYSTIFGVYIFSGCMVAILAFLSLTTLHIKSHPLGGVITIEHVHDVGKLLFAFVVFWAYIAFSQFMLIWYGNIPEETLWYAHRWEHGWRPVSILLAAGHFVIPFFFLLSRDVKRNALPLSLVSIWLLVMHYLDLYWLVMPNLSETFHFHIVDVLSLLGVFGLFLAAFTYLSGRPPLVPIQDPRLKESLRFENF